MFNNTAWPGLRSEREVYDLDSDPEELANLWGQLESTEQERLSQVFQERLQTTSAIKMVFVNPTSEWIESHWATKNHLVFRHAKSFDLPCDCIVRPDPLTLVVRQPPGSSFHLFLEGDLRSSFSLRTPDSGFLELPDPTGTVPLALRARWDGAGWRQAPLEEQTLGTSKKDRYAEILVSDQRRFPPRDVRKESLETKQQLEALGYVDP